MYATDMSLLGPNWHPVGKCVAIGWLGLSHAFTKGLTAHDFRDKLRSLCRFPVRKTRGFHKCEFCSQERGNGEVHVRSLGGEIFVAPMLISHYVDAHEYQPPEAFVAAVERVDLDIDSYRDSLSDRIRAFSDNSSDENRSRFYEAFVQGRVGTRVHTPTDLRNPTLPSATSPLGYPLTIVIADVEKLSKREASTFMELEARVVLAIAVANGGGIVVEGIMPGREAWATIPREDVIRLATRGRPGESRRSFSAGYHCWLA